MDQAPGEFLAWDSEHFGCRIARVRGDRLDPAGVAKILEWAEADAIDCLYFLAVCDDPPTVRLAEENGFALVDLRLTLSRPLAGRKEEPPRAPRAEEPRVRPCREDDLPVLRNIARSGHRDSRFYFDGRFSEERCDALYERWVANSLRGFADALWVIDHRGRPAGYLSARLRHGVGKDRGNENRDDEDRGDRGDEARGDEARGDEDRVGEIGLIAVASEARGQKLGSALLEETLDWFASRGVGQAEVVTQGRNIGAQRFYQEHGFRSRSLELWYHRWREGPPP